MRDIYWECKGKYQKELNMLQNKVPDIGYTDNRYMNLYIAASKLYYDIHNSGGCILEVCYTYDFQEYIVPFKYELKSIQLITSIKPLLDKDKLEEFMDEIVLFLKDRDVSYTSREVYQDYCNKVLSGTEKKGFGRVVFGNKLDYSKWINFRITNMNFQLV